MSDSTIGIAENNNPSKYVDNEQLVVSGSTVQRQRVQVAGKTSSSIAAVLSADPAGSEQGLVTRLVDAVAPIINFATVAAVLAGQTVTTNSDAIAVGTTAKLLAIEAASSVPIKVDLRTVTNDVESGSRIVGITGFNPTFFMPIPAKRTLTVVRDVAAGFHGFRVYVTNLDPSLSADVYVTFIYDTT